MSGGIPQGRDFPVQTVCVICQRPFSLLKDTIDEDKHHEFSDEPCQRCKNWTKDGNYIFVSISDKSEPPNRIKRTGFCWYAELEEVKEEFPEDHEIFQSKDKIVFIRTSEAVALNLLTEEQAEKIEDPKHDGPINPKGSL